MILAIVLLSFVTSSLAQIGTEFWFAAPAISSGHENTPIVFMITTYSQPADITITQPANPSFFPYTFHLNSNTAITKDITTQLYTVENKPSNSILNYGIQIKSTANISAYYEVGHSLNPEIFPLKGDVAKGLSFLIPSQNMFNDHVGLVPAANNGFVIVATEDNTTVTITPSNNAVGHAANIAFPITLNKGQSYALVSLSNVGAQHLGGSTIVADKPICVTIYDDSIEFNTSWDLAGDQIVPEINTGKEFIIVRGALNHPSYPNQDFYYIWPTVDGTVISVGGVPVSTNNRGQVYAGQISSSSAYITTSNPVYVLQFTGVGTEVAETSLPSIKCTGSQTVSFVRSTSEAFYLNLLCKTIDVANFSLNGNQGIITASMFNVVPGTGNLWSAARIDVSSQSLNSIIVAGTTTTISNSSGLFHLGFSEWRGINRSKTWIFF